MNSIPRTAFGRFAFMVRPANARLPSLLPLSFRGVASSVSGRPGSQTLPHAAENIKEEVGNTVTDIAKTLAGGAEAVKSIGKSDSGFLGITSGVAATVPAPIMAFGLAGALPYLGTSATSLYLARQAGLGASGLAVKVDPSGMMAVLDQCLHIQVTYGAVLLSFLGALHWGMEFAGYGGHQGNRRLMLGAAPVLFAWPTLALEPTTALIAQWIGFTAIWAADVRATNRGWTPTWYAQYRFYLTLLVGSCIIGTLAGTSYFGPVAGHDWTSRDLANMRAERRRLQKENAGTYHGDIEALPAEENGDAFVIIKQKAEPEEGEGESASDEDQHANEE